MSTNLILTAVPYADLNSMDPESRRIYTQRKSALSAVVRSGVCVCVCVCVCVFVVTTDTGQIN